MAFNIIYTNNPPSTVTQTLPGVSNVPYFTNIPQTAVAAPATNIDAAAVFQSNGENIGNAQRKLNPLPPGLTS
jgi:hypothetical protein